MSTFFMLHLDCLPDCRLRCIGGTIPPRVCIRRSPRNPNPRLIVDQLILEPSKELKAAPRPVVCTDDLLEKKVGIDANDAEDTDVEPLVPMFGAEIAVQPQLVGSNLLCRSMVPAPL